MEPISRKKFAVMAVIAVWTAALGAAFGYIYQKFPRPQKLPEVRMSTIVNDNLSDQAREMMKGYWTLALFGVDSRNGSVGSGNQSDMVMICNVDMDTGEIRLASVYRDTYLKINESGRLDKINQAYCEGGPAQAIQALNENLDLKIDDYVSFNWKGVVDAINLLGGIDLSVSDSEFKVINGFITETVESTGVPSSHLKHAGMNHLDGVQAVSYARLRKMDTDFQRTERQREVAQLVLEKAKKADIAVLNQILVTVLPQTSTSVGISDLFPLAKNLGRFQLGGTAGFPFRLEDKMIGRKDCVIPVNLEENVSKLHEFLFEDEEYNPSVMIREIDRKIENKVKKHS